ncbi:MULTISPECIES: sigma-70 family RNA polymerase sigma factor [Paenibacillus]|uniref:sigma-70 family RNA polymerase sigma factor n=1 Tax=Paenibacillus TaxID=44249 RepID=UPI0022B93E05|nr:sigma-70 family RNA polymerase sigma factor [Paenibacillus caseinilyticus]MCZ8521828.1 sigma-70 family RNA polymerase sigma factor [Paenibacillus caseinilyticus]
MSSEETVRAAQRGDDDAFYSLVSDQKEQLYRIAYAYLRSEPEALEAIQEVTCRAYLKLPRLREPKYFATWLTRILIHYCIDERKRRRRVLPVPHTREEAAAADAPDDRIRMEQAVERLKPKLRHVIVLKYYQDMTLSEIASLLERPEGTVKSWLHQALKELRRTVGEEEGYDYA